MKLICGMKLFLHFIDCKIKYEIICQTGVSGNAMFWNLLN
jgi:hypothetical protein